jgi:hypothetical protein
MIACGSKRTLLMTLRLIIEEERFDSRRLIKVDCSAHADSPGGQYSSYSMVAGLNPYHGEPACAGQLDGLRIGSA